jgi:sortase family protein
MRRATGRIGPWLAIILGVAASQACGPPLAGAGDGPSAPGSPGASAGDVRDPVGSASLPTLAPEAVRTRVPTRIRIPALQIDLPVVAPPAGDADHFPYCNVAEYLPTMARPGRPGSTFIYAHARAGMFLPIHDAAASDDGRSLLGLEVQVFTSDERRFTYEVTEVRRHVVSLDFVYGATAEQLVLQTSEGPRATPEKTVVIAVPKGETAASAEASHVKATPVRCL